MKEKFARRIIILKEKFIKTKKKKSNTKLPKLFY